MNKFCWRKDGVGGSLEVLSESPEFISVREPNSQISFEIERARFERDYTYDPAPPAGPVGQIKRRQHGEIIGGLVLVLAILAPMSSLAAKVDCNAKIQEALAEGYTEQEIDTKLREAGPEFPCSYAWQRAKDDAVYERAARIEKAAREAEVQKAKQAQVDLEAKRILEQQVAEQEAWTKKEQDMRDKIRRVQMVAQSQAASEMERVARLHSDPRLVDYLDRCPITDNVRDYVRRASDSAPLPNECK
jgi:hypothetical protein